MGTDLSTHWWTRDWLFLVVARAFAALLFLFFSAAFVLLVVDADLGARLTPLLRWGGEGTDSGRAYELMISAIYVVWAPFIWVAAGSPRQHRLFLDFTVAANAAHFGLMASLGVAMHGERAHMHGDVLLGWLGLLPLAVLWVLVRPSDRRRSKRAWA